MKYFRITFLKAAVDHSFKSNWPFLDRKIQQEADLISELHAAQTKLSMELVTQFFSDGERKNSELFDRFRASIGKFLPQTY